VSTAQHFSSLSYAIPSERAWALFPHELSRHAFELVETSYAGRPHCWLSVISYLDRQPLFAGLGANEGFEQISYRIHVRRGAQSYQWLLNTSVGSLMAVGARHLWSHPWHLSAMEFRLSYNETQRRYQSYRLQLQSEHDNAVWDLEDSGLPLSQPAATALPNFLFDSVIRDCFGRRDGSVGTRQTRFRFLDSTRGSLKHASGDLLVRQGLLTAEELTRPSLVLLSRAVSFELDAPDVLVTAKTGCATYFKAAA
jgi:hypothetical protein